jgi:hypothetical protein
MKAVIMCARFDRVPRVWRPRYESHKMPEGEKIFDDGQELIMTSDAEFGKSALN